MHRLLRPFALGLWIILLAAHTASADESQSAWNQVEVLSITAELSGALAELVSDPGLDAQQATAYQQRNHEAAIATVKRVKPRVEDLRRRVASGEGREATTPYFERVSELREDIAAYAEEAWLPEATRARAQRVRALFDRLAGFYP